MHFYEVPILSSYLGEINFDMDALFYWDCIHLEAKNNYSYIVFVANK